MTVERRNDRAASLPLGAERRVANRSPSWQSRSLQ